MSHHGIIKVTTYNTCSASYLEIYFRFDSTCRITRLTDKPPEQLYSDGQIPITQYQALVYITNCETITLLASGSWCSKWKTDYGNIDAA